jgi:hypothetical protein
MGSCRGSAQQSNAADERRHPGALQKARHVME